MAQPGDKSESEAEQGARIGSLPSVSVSSADQSRLGDEELVNWEPSSFASNPGSDQDVPPASYGKRYGEILDDEAGSGTRADVTDDGRVNIHIKQPTRGLSSLLVPALRSQLNLLSTQHQQEPYVPPTLSSKPGEKPPPPLNVVIHVVGSRGDVQPFVALGKVLKEQYQHRVRLATHPVFRDFVIENGLEFFDIAGDPAELMAFMVKNPGLMPGFDTLRRGDIGRRRREIGKMIRRCWRSCIETGDGSGVEASDKNMEDWSRKDGWSDDCIAQKPFVADAIIANPPSFAHIHCAEKLGIPLHLMFTMPWSPTQAFPHPLANIQATNADTNMTNFISYSLVDMMTWQGLGDVINRFRQKSLGLEPISPTWAPGMLARLRLPWTYCWSPALIPKPRDWGSHISISGFFFLNLATNYTPDPELAAFLDAGPPPVYIGFGSIVVDDPNAMTKMVFEAVKKTNQRALVSKGWGGFGADQIGIPEGVFMLGNVPHDWLFKRVSAVVHHGGAGTTAAGIACGRPTVVVPFFGDQPFWGAMVARAGAGPKPVPYKELNADILAESIHEALRPTTLEKAKQLAESISKEQGTAVGADAFHQQLDVDKLRCTLCPMRAAVWRLKRTQIKLSAFAATVLGNEKLISFNDLKLYRPREHYTEDAPFDPLTGGASALMGTMGSMAMGIADMPISALKAVGIHPDADKSKSSPKPPESPSGPDGGGSGSVTPQKPSDNPSNEAPLPTASSDDAAASQPETAHEIANQMAQAATVAGGNVNGAGLPGSSNENVPESEKKKKLNMQQILADPKASFEDAIDTGKGIFRIASAGIKSPMDFTLGLARGFHNAPKLYGDESVRQNEKITDFSSGLRVAGKEFGYGFYDGISGIVTQPWDGAKKEGAAGFFKGFGKGLGGVVLKPGAAIWGLPGYTSQGIYKELQKQFGPSVSNYIIASRTAQGYEDVRLASEEERAAVVKRWKEVKPYIRRKKTLAEEGMDGVKNRSRSLSAAVRSRTGSEASRKQPPQSQNQTTQRKADEKPQFGRTDTTTSMDSGVWSPVDSLSRAPTLTAGSTSTLTLTDKNPPSYEDAVTPQASSNKAANHSTTEHEQREFEEAIRRSVAETSTGNSEEDALIERAIRASVAELHASSKEVTGDDDSRVATEEGIRQASEKLRHDPTVTAHRFTGGKQENIDSGFGTETESVVDSEDHGELALALAASRDEHRERETEAETASREEEIVMQYMMKQSLAEEEVKRNQTGDA